MKDQKITLWKFYGLSSITEVKCSVFNLPLLLKAKGLTFDTVHGIISYTSDIDGLIVYVKDLK